MSATFPFRGRLGQQEELCLPLVATRGECSKIGIWQYRPAILLGGNGTEKSAIITLKLMFKF